MKLDCLIIFPLSAGLRKRIYWHNYFYEAKCFKFTALRFIPLNIKNFLNNGGSVKFALNFVLNNF